jgi:hypothetical protein
MPLVPSLLLLQADSDAAALAAGGILAGIGIGFFVVMLAILIVVLAGLWKMFEKAGQPGWAAIIPFYNIYVLLQIAGKPGWWLVLYLIPLVNIAIGIIVAIDLAKAFGQTALWGFCLLFLLSGIGYLMLGFGNYRYFGPPTPALAHR